MSYSELKKIMAEKAAELSQDIESIFEQIEQNIELETRKADSILHLSIDLIQDSTFSCDFKLDLDAIDYNLSNEYAFNCLEISLMARKVLPRKVRDWLNNSLLCYDILLLNYVQTILHYTFARTGQPKEKEVYDYLTGLEDMAHKNIGRYFDHLYRERNSLVHVQYINKAGVRRVKVWTNAQLAAKLNYIIDLFSKALSIFLKQYKTEFEKLHD